MSPFFTAHPDLNHAFFLRSPAPKTGLEFINSLRQGISL